MTPFHDGMLMMPGFLDTMPPSSRTCVICCAFVNCSSWARKVLLSGGMVLSPPLNNTFRAQDEQFTNAQQITQVLDEGGIVSKKPGIINMPSWKGVINTAQADAIAAYILAGFPHVGATYDPDPAKAPAIYTTYACIGCHGQVGQEGAPNPLTADKSVPGLRNPDDNVPLSELRSVLMEGSIPDPGTKCVIFMPAWGQILSMDQLNTILPYTQDGPKAKSLPAPPASGRGVAAGGAGRLFAFGPSWVYGRIVFSWSIERIWPQAGMKITPLAPGSGMEPSIKTERSSLSGTSSSGLRSPGTDLSAVSRLGAPSCPTCP